MLPFFGSTTIPLSGCRELKEGDIVGAAFSHLLRVPLESLDIHFPLNDVSTVAEPDMIPHPLHQLQLPPKTPLPTSPTNPPLRSYRSDR